MVWVAMVRSPVAGVQLTLNVVVTVLPEGTVTLRGLAPPTVQFPATFVRATLWLPAERLVNVTLLLVPIGWL